VADAAERQGRGRALAMLAPAYLWLLFAVFLPLAAMAWFSLLSDVPMAGRDWHLTLANYRAFLDSPAYPLLLWKSLRIAAVVTALCLVVGFPCALVLARAIRGRAREALFLLVILPFWSNALVRVFSWTILLRPNGVLDAALSAVLPGEVRLGLAFTETAVVIGLVHSYVPYVILTAYLALQAIDASLIEAARSLGAGPWRILRRILLPLSLPGLVAGAVLVFVPVAGSFMEPRLLGGRMGTTFGTVIEDQFTAVFNWPLGAALSFILLAVVLLVLAAASPALRRSLA
jgi:spermidine/putrescine transport system permease protein